MSGPKCDNFFIDQERLHQQEAARQAEEERKRRQERQRRRSRALVRINETKGAIDRLEEHLTSLWTLYPHNAISADIPTCSVPDTRDVDSLEGYADSLCKACRDAEKKLAAAEEKAHANTELKAAMRSALDDLSAVSLRTAEQVKEATELLGNLPIAMSDAEQKQLNMIQDSLLKIIDGQESLTATLQDDIANLGESTEADFSRKVAGEVIQDTLEELGYTVEDGFATLFVEGGVIHFQKSAWSTYHVRLRVNRQADEMRLHMIREEKDAAQDQQAKDMEMETEWCAEYKELVSVLSDKGIQTEPIKHYVPGAVPVHNIHPADIRMQKVKRRRPGRKDTKYTMGS